MTWVLLFPENKHIKHNMVSGIFSSTWRAMKCQEYQGNVRQQGAEYILGPGSAFLQKHEFVYVEKVGGGAKIMFFKYKSKECYLFQIFFRWRSPFHAHLWEFHRPNSNKWPFTVSGGQASEFSEWHKGHRCVSLETKEAPLCSENFIEILLRWLAYCVDVGNQQCFIYLHLFQKWMHINCWYCNKIILNVHL